jgi:hypothetical protein
MKLTYQSKENIMTDASPASKDGYDFSLVDIILSEDERRHISLADYCSNAPTDKLLKQCKDLDEFSRTSENLYEKVRALFFLYAIHRFHLTDLPAAGSIPYEGYKHLLDREFMDAIDVFLAIHQKEPSKAISSALAKSYYHLGFQTLADQVRLSVKNFDGNAFLFQVLEPRKYPKTIHSDLIEGKVLCEKTPVRMDLSHCGWSDIFFLGMDFPEGARVLNASVDLAVRGQHEFPEPVRRCTCCCVIDCVPCFVLVH